MFLRSILFSFIVLLHTLPTSSGNNGTTSMFRKVFKSINGLDVNNAKEIIKDMEDPNCEIVEGTKIRTKRQAGGGKYMEASLMGQTKLARLVIQLLKNSVADIYVGAPHPVHEVVPKTFMEILKLKNNKNESSLWDRIYKAAVRGDLEKYMGTAVESKKRFKRSTKEEDKKPKKTYQDASKLPWTRLWDMGSQVMKDFFLATTLGKYHFKGKGLEANYKPVKNIPFWALVNYVRHNVHPSHFKNSQEFEN